MAFKIKAQFIFKKNIMIYILKKKEKINVNVVVI